MTTSPFALAIGIGALLVAAACGGSSTSSTAPASSVGPSPFAPAPRLLQDGRMNLAAPSGDTVHFALASITDAASGTWEATVDWTDPANELWMWVANGVCTAQQFAREDCPFEATCPCSFTIRSETATPKPRVLTIPNAPGGTRTLIALNLGPREDTASYRVMLTPSSLTASSVAASAAASISTGTKTIRGR